MFLRLSRLRSVISTDTLFEFSPKLESLFDCFITVYIEVYALIETDSESPFVIEVLHDKLSEFFAVFKRYPISDYFNEDTYFVD